MSESNSKHGNWPHPAQFPLGSAESRAAARAILVERDKVDLRIVFNGIKRPRPVAHSYRCVSEGKIVEIVFPGEG
jgi:hypothetical protein